MKLGLFSYPTLSNVQKGIQSREDSQGSSCLLNSLQDEPKLPGSMLSQRQAIPLHQSYEDDSYYNESISWSDWDNVSLREMSNWEDNSTLMDITSSDKDKEEEFWSGYLLAEAAF